MQFRVSYKLEFTKEELEELELFFPIVSDDEADTVRRALSMGLLVPSGTTVEFEVVESKADAS